MLTAVLVTLVGLVLVPLSASAAATGDGACGWVTGQHMVFVGCSSSNELMWQWTTDMPAPASPVHYRFRQWVIATGVEVNPSAGVGPLYAPGVAYTTPVDQLTSSRLELWAVDGSAGGWVWTAKVPGADELYVRGSNESTVAAPVPPAPPALAASTCLNQWAGAKASWTADNGLTIIYTWVGAAPAKGWYWFGAAPGKVVTATTMPKGPIPSTAKLAGPVGWYGLMKYPQPGPMVKGVRVYSIDDLGCYKDIPVTGGTTDAVVTDPTVPGNSTGVGSGTGDVLPPGATDATPDPATGPFDSCGNFFTDSLCYITGLPSWLFVPSEATKTDFGNVGTEFATKAPIGWVTLAKNLADRVATPGGGTPGYECASGPGWDSGAPEINTQGNCSALGVVRLEKAGGRGGAYVPFIGMSEPGGRVLELFRPIATIVLLAGLYMGVGVWIGKRVLEKAVT